MNRKQNIKDIVLNELYGPSGYLARMLDQELIDKGEKPLIADVNAAKRGKNPYLTASGRTRYRTGTRSKILGTALFMKNLMRRRGEQAILARNLGASAVGPNVPLSTKQRRIGDIEKLLKKFDNSAPLLQSFITISDPSK
jgi:hypothetical protein